MLRMRALFAVLIAFAVALAPVSSAWAALQVRASMDTVTASDLATSDAEMSDCMKAMQTQGQPQDQSCPCCDTPSKAPCAGSGACLAKCSVQVIAAFACSAELRSLVGRLNWPVQSNKPPDWAFAPPAPPPRA